MSALAIFACERRPLPAAAIASSLPPVQRREALPAAATPTAAVAQLHNHTTETVDDGLLAPEPGAARFGAVAGQQSRSVGTAQNGHLLGGQALQEAQSLRILPQTKRNALYFGTAELVGLLQRSAAILAQDQPGSVLRVANLSREQGGDIGPSVSHNSGRDADVMFFAVDRYGSAREPDNFCHFDSAGVADGPATDAGRYEFDAARNWKLVRTWLSDPDVVVQWIFVSIPLRNQLLDHALRAGEPESLRQRAARVLVQPRDSSPHADHFHLRIACPPGDRPACVDGGGLTAQARDAQIEALLKMYHEGSPAEQRYARELLTLPPDADAAALPPIEGVD